MNKNIINAIEHELTPQLLEKVSAYTGEGHNLIISSLENVISYLFDKADTWLEWNESPATLLNLIKDCPSLDLGKTSLDTLMQFSAKGHVIHDILNTILPDGQEHFERHLAEKVGVKHSSASTLMSLGALLLFKPMKAYLQTRTTQGLSLKSWLKDEKVQGVDLHHLLNKKPAVKVENKKCKTKKWPWLLLLLALLAGALFMLRSCHNNDAQTTAHTTVWKNLGAFFKRALPDGTTLNIPELGVENQLLKFIESDQPVSDTLWFSFDRLLFETNSPVLKPESQEQLKNIADIMKAYPRVDLLLAGYTDNTGTDDINMQLSQQRADSVQHELVNMGVATERLIAKGYGSTNPVAPNDSDENRAKNRRIEIQVTQK
ncbi:MAG: OmpA family protein [Scandinavium sp.]|uniref:OmpA family protein n=1 Tax=Scandinavium sp. TaxID=2830653 RepID=UPI003F33115A